MVYQRENFFFFCLECCAKILFSRLHGGGDKSDQKIPFHCELKARSCSALVEVADAVVIVEPTEHYSPTSRPAKTFDVKIFESINDFGELYGRSINDISLKLPLFCYF
jgi:hypothetical protein